MKLYHNVTLDCLSLYGKGILDIPLRKERQDKRGVFWGLEISKINPSISHVKVNVLNFETFFVVCSFHVKHPSRMSLFFVFIESIHPLKVVTKFIIVFEALKIQPPNLGKNCNSTKHINVEKIFQCFSFLPSDGSSRSQNILCSNIAS